MLHPCRDFCRMQGYMIKKRKEKEKVKEKKKSVIYTVNTEYIVK